MQLVKLVQGKIDVYLQHYEVDVKELTIGVVVTEHVSAHGQIRLLNAMRHKENLLRVKANGVSRVMVIIHKDAELCVI